MKSEQKISVVIPIYNVEKYLATCIESVLKQTYCNMEIILVDDGSTDLCGKICDKYAELDNRVRVIHKMNGGLSSARNAGIKIATGNYITFIDSDDYVSEVYMEQLIYGMQEGIDIVVCDMSEEETKLSHTLIERFQKYLADEALGYVLREEVLNTSACAKLFRLSLFHNCEFPIGKIYEDYATIPKIIMKAQNVLHYHNILYFYRANPESITSVQFNERRMQYFVVSDMIEEFISRNNPQLINLVVMRKTRYAISFYKQIKSSGYSNFDTEQYLRKIIRENIISYIYKTKYSFLSKMYGLVVVICPALAKLIA